MAVSVPDTFVAGLSGKYILSIRLSADGLSFSAYNPEKPQSYFYREAAFDRNTPYLASLEELFFANELFTRSYRKINVVFVTPQYTLAPAEMLPEERKAELFSMNFSVPAKRILGNPADGDAMLLFGVNEDVYEFCSRSLINPAFIHHITPQLEVLKKQGMADGRNHLFANVHRKIVDLVAFSEGKLLLVNTFGYEQPDDLLYYILNVWRQLGMDQLKDQLSLYGIGPVCKRLARSLEVYIQNISKTDIPSEAYLMGGEIMLAPLDLIFQTVCE